MKIIVKIWVILLTIMMWGCKPTNTQNDQDKGIQTPDKSRVESMETKNPYIANNRDIFIPEHDYQLDKKIHKAVAHLVDTNKIYKIYQYQNHYVVHYLDWEDRTKTAKNFLNGDLKITKYLNFVESNPYMKKDLEIITREIGNPVYNLKGKSRKNIEKIIPNIKWDNEGEPTHAWLWAGGSNFAATITATLHQLYIVGTEGSMAVNSKLTILGKHGQKIDSIELIGSEIWDPSITDDGRFMAYRYGRAFPEEDGGGKVTQHFTIYDIEKREHIFEIRDFKMSGSRIGWFGNFFYFSKYSVKPEYKNRLIVDPHENRIYKIETKGATGWGAYKQDGVYIHPHDPPSLRLLSWEKDFESISFDNYKQ